MNRAARAKQPYNQNSSTKSFLQQAHKLTKKWGHPIDRVELFKETHVWDG